MTNEREVSRDCESEFAEALKDERMLYVAELAYQMGLQNGATESMDEALRKIDAQLMEWSRNRRGEPPNVLHAALALGWKTGQRLAAARVRSLMTRQQMMEQCPGNQRFLI